MAAPVTVDEGTFPQTVLASATPVLVDFTATWCPPCRMIEPLLHELSTEYAGRLLFTEVDVDEEPDLAARYNVYSMPTLIIFDKGREVHRLVGYAPKGALTRQIERALGHKSA